MTDAEIAERFPRTPSGRWGDGETTEQVATRALEAIERIRIAQPEGPVLVVSHGGPLRLILARLDVEPGPIGNCDVFRIDA